MGSAQPLEDGKCRLCLSDPFPFWAVRNPGPSAPACGSPALTPHLVTEERDPMERPWGAAGFRTILPPSHTEFG